MNHYPSILAQSILAQSILPFGISIPVNGITLLAVGLPLISVLAFVFFFVMRKRAVEKPPVEHDWQKAYSESFQWFEIAPARSEGESLDDDFAVPDMSSLPPVDELTMPVKIPSFSLDTVATLKYVRGGENLPERLAIRKGEPALFGRSKSVCDHVINDVRVSRLHAKVTQIDANFYVQDEGSSGGTFVNQERLAVGEKHRLIDGDLINFNEVAYQFLIHN